MLVDFMWEMLVDFELECWFIGLDWDNINEFGYDVFGYSL